MDNQLTQQIGEWLKANPQDRDYSAGVTMLLRLNANRIMHRNLTLRPNMEAVEYHLQKFYNFRVLALTHDQVAAMSTEVDKIAKECSLADPPSPKEETAEQAPKGKRADHDTLPSEIQALYVENLSVLRRMREVHLRLRSLSLVDHPCPDSERYPFLKELIDLDKKYRSNWAKYDTYTAK